MSPAALTSCVRVDPGGPVAADPPEPPHAPAPTPKPTARATAAQHALRARELHRTMAVFTGATYEPGGHGPSRLQSTDGKRSTARSEFTAGPRSLVTWATRTFSSWRTTKQSAAGS